MKDRTIATIALGSAIAGACFAQSPTLLDIDIDNVVTYFYDAPDASKFGA